MLRRKRWIPILAAVILAVPMAAFAGATNMRPVGPLGDNDLANLLANSPTDTPPGIYYGGPVYDAVADQSSAAVFTHSASSASIATFVVEMTTWAGTNRLGIYDFDDPTKKVQLFDGSAGPGSQTFVSFLEDGRVFVMFVDSGVTNFSGNFGFYVDVYEAPVGAGGDGISATYDYTFYTQDALNPGGGPQALIYQGNDQTLLMVPPYAPGLFMPADWIIAFDDAPVIGQYSGASDRDYSDMVIIVESIVPVDPPGRVPTVSEWGMAVMTLLLLAGGKVFFRRRLAPARIG